MYKNKKNRLYWMLMGLLILIMTWFSYAAWCHNKIAEMYGDTSSQAVAWMGVIGLFLTMMVTVFVVYFQEEKHVIREREKEEAEIQNIMRSIREEIAVNLEIFEKMIGCHFNECGENAPFMHKYYVRENPFPIYSGSSGKIGMIEDHSLRKQIIATYTYAYNFIQSFMANNDLIEKLVKIKEQSNQTDDKHHLAYYNAAADLANQLGNMKEKIWEEIKLLLEMLTKEIGDEQTYDHLFLPELKHSQTPNI